MAKNRNLNSQFQFMIGNNFKCGVSKRAENKNKQLDNTATTYSIQRTEELRDIAKNLSNWMKDNHPEIKLIKDITPSMYTEYLQERYKTCNTRSIKEYASCVNKLVTQINVSYRTNIDIKDIRLPEPKHEAGKVRDIAMSKEDYTKLRTAGYDSTSGGAIAVELSYKLGLRAKECARLGYGNIDLEKQVVHIIDGCKNGKKRDVPIRDEDISYFTWLKEDTRARGEYYVCYGINEDSINKYINRTLTALDLKEKYQDTSNHAIRKLYAIEEYDKRLEEGMTERKAWSEVQELLGHGKGFRQALFETYICR